MWKEALGADVTLTQVRNLRFSSRKLKAALRRLFVRVGQLIYDDAYTYTGYLTSGFGINLPKYRNDEYDALAERARTEPDENRRRRMVGAGRAHGAGRSCLDTALFPYQSALGVSKGRRLVRTTA